LSLFIVSFLLTQEFIVCLSGLKFITHYRNVLCKRRPISNSDGLYPFPKELFCTDQKNWGKVKQDSYTPRSYIVETERGDVRRNRRHLAKVKTDNDEQSEESCLTFPQFF
jgi:hypothetical protein